MAEGPSSLCSGYSLRPSPRSPRRRPARCRSRSPGNHLVNANGKNVRLIGVNRSGSEYSCSGPDGQGGHGYAVFQGPVNDRAIQAMKTWKVNAVALPLNEACWLGGIGGLNPQFTGENYRRRSRATSTGSTLTGSTWCCASRAPGPDDHVYGAVSGDAESPMADADHSLDFWSSVADALQATTTPCSSTPTTSRTRSPGAAH